MAHLTPRGTRLIGSVADQQARREKLELLELLDEKARRHFDEFVLACTSSGYDMGWVHEQLCQQLDWFLAEVVAKRSPRLMIFMPPRHGKSELASRKFPAYALGRYPDLSIIAASYASDLANAMNRDVQRTIETDSYETLFPGTRLNDDNVRTNAQGGFLRNSEIFEVVGREGVYKSAGVRGGVTGRGMHIGVIDDPVKDAAEAASPVVRGSVWEWYQSTFYTRLMPGGGILLIMTRWHEDDLAGRLLKAAKDGGEQWRVLKFPAIAVEDELEPGTEKLLRKMGEPLHPARYDAAQLARIKMAVGSRVWASLYQQDPTIAGGNIFKRENWKWLKPPKLLSEMSTSDRADYFRALGIKRIVQRWDTALGGKKSNDYSACVTLGIGPSKYYVIDVWKSQCEYPEVKRQMQTLYDKWKPSKVVVEGGGSASGKASVQELKRTTRLPLLESTTVMDKVLRAELISPSHEAGLVTVFEGEPWVADFIEQCTNFPNAKFDDDVDAFIGTMEEAVGGKAPMRISEEFLRMVG